MKKFLTASFCALVLLASCTKDDVPANTSVPTILGKWQLDNYTLQSYRNGSPVSSRVVTRDSMPACQQDDYWEYRADSTGTAYYGTLCSGERLTSDPFQWQYDGSYLLKEYNSGVKDGMSISNMTINYYTALDTIYPSANYPDTTTLLQQYKRLD